MNTIFGIEPYHFLQYIIRPSLISIDMYSDNAAMLLLGTAAHESHIGKFLHQIGGPALGIYQIEPDTHTDIWKNYIEYRSRMKRDIIKLYPDISTRLDDQKLIYDLRYATIIARLIYRRVPHELPNKNDVRGQADYWKTYYNTILGKGSKSRFIQNIESIGVIHGNL